MDYNYLLIIIGIGAIIVELLLGAATGFDLLILGVIFIISGTIGSITSSFTYSLVSITILSFLYLFIGRKMVKKSLSIATHKTNVDNLIGKTGFVIKKINKKTAGQVKVEGEVWRAVGSHEFDPGQEVVVQSVSGVTLKVN